MESLEAHAAGTSQGKERQTRVFSRPESRARSLVTTSSKTAGGIIYRFCNSAHFLTQCPEYLALSVQRQFQEITQRKLF